MCGHAAGSASRAQGRAPRHARHGWTAPPPDRGRQGRWIRFPCQRRRDARVGARNLLLQRPSPRGRGPGVSPSRTWMRPGGSTKRWASPPWGRRVAGSAHARERSGPHRAVPGHVRPRPPDLRPGLGPGSEPVEGVRRRPRSAAEARRRGRDPHDRRGSRRQRPGRSDGPRAPWSVAAHLRPSARRDHHGPWPMCPGRARYVQYRPISTLPSAGASSSGPRPCTWRYCPGRRSGWTR